MNNEQCTMNNFNLSSFHFHLSTFNMIALKFEHLFPQLIVGFLVEFVAFWGVLVGG